LPNKELNNRYKMNAPPDIQPYEYDDGVMSLAMNGCPTKVRNPDRNRTGDALLEYYENPPIAGSVLAGIEPPYKQSWDGDG